MTRTHTRKRQLSHLGERISERKRVFSPMEAVELGIFSRLVLLSPPSSTARWSREIAAHIEKMVRASKEDTIAGWAAKRLGDDPAIHAIHVAYELDGTITCWPMSQFEKSERDAYNRGAFPATYIRVPAIALACQIFEDAIRTRLLTEEFRHRETLG